MDASAVTTAARRARAAATAYAVYWSVAVGTFAAHSLWLGDLGGGPPASAWLEGLDARSVDDALGTLGLVLLLVPGPIVASAFLVFFTQRLVVALEPARTAPSLATFVTASFPFVAFPVWLGALDGALSRLPRAPRPAHAATLIAASWGGAVAALVLVVPVLAMVDAPRGVAVALLILLFGQFWLLRIVAGLRLRRACGDVLAAEVADAARVQHAVPVSGG